MTDIMMTDAGDEREGVSPEEQAEGRDPSYLLPVVSEEVFSALAREVEERGGFRAFRDELLDGIDRNNPDYANGLDEFIAGFLEDERWRFGEIPTEALHEFGEVMYAFSHELLRRQAVANKIREQVFGSIAER